MVCDEQRIGAATGRPVPIRPSSPRPIISSNEMSFTSSHGSGVRNSRPAYNHVPGRYEHQKQKKQLPMISKSRNQQRRQDDHDDEEKRISAPNQPTETPATSPTDRTGEERTAQPTVQTQRPADKYQLTILSHNVRGAKESREVDGT